MRIDNVMRVGANCPGCGQAVIERDWHEVPHYRLDAAGLCQHCGTAIVGRFGHFDKPFGARCIPVHLDK